MPILKYCKMCVMPSSKPNITFDELGVCNACRSAAIKKGAVDGIDWEQREKEFDELIHWAKEQNAPYYDAMVPVSGGKDSITQVHRLLNRGLRILAVNVDYGIKTSIGRSNLKCIPNMGANLITFRPELNLHKHLIRLGLEEYGDPDLLSHTLLHAYPLHVAQRFQIPLSLLGENSAFEYGGNQELSSANEITRQWFDTYAANKGMTARVISQKHGIPFERLWQYDFPDTLESDQSAKAIFCSYYYRWDSNENLKIAKSYGFQELEKHSEGTYRNFVGVDEKINRLHQYLKVLKYGYGRASDHASEDIRLGLISRQHAKSLVKQHDLVPLGEDNIHAYCDFLGYNAEDFMALIEKHRNKSIWTKDQRGNWFIEGYLED